MLALWLLSGCATPHAAGEARSGTRVVGMVEAGGTPINLDGATSIAFTLTTAPINNENFYTDVKVAGASAVMTFLSTSNQFLSVDGLSRFFALAPSTNGIPTTGASIACTIDVIVRV